MMQGKPTNWQRIEAVIKWANMTTNYFACYIGLARGENLYQIKRGNNGISMDVAQRIVNKFPQIDKLWLLTGEGQMFAEERIKGTQIPFYKTDVEAGVGNIEELEADMTFIIPPFDDCDFAMYYTGRAMGQAVPSGAVVFLKRAEVKDIIPGNEYVVVCDRFTTLRIVRFIDGEDKLRLVPGDKENFDEMTIDTDEITSLYRVKGKLIINN